MLGTSIESWIGFFERGTLFEGAGVLPMLAKKLFKYSAISFS